MRRRFSSRKSCGYFHQSTFHVFHGSRSGYYRDAIDDPSPEAVKAAYLYSFLAMVAGILKSLIDNLNMKIMTGAGKSFYPIGYDVLRKLIRSLV